MAPATDRAQTSSVTITVAFSGANKLKLAKISASQKTRMTRNGAGIELPAFAETVRASPGARIGLPEIRLGLIPGAGGTVSLPRRIGRWRTAFLALTGTAIEAEQALTWGLIDEIDPGPAGSHLGQPDPAAR